MAALLNVIIACGGTTAYREPFDERRIVASFIASRFAIGCFCAVEGNALLGFQALEWSDPDWPGPDRLPAGWALIATYVAPDRQGEGVGRALFAATHAAARAANVPRIDATIRRENLGGQAYYAGIDFTDYRSGPDTVSKKLELG